MSLSSRLRTAASLPSAERRLTLRAVGLIVLTRIALAVAGYPRVRRWADGPRAAGRHGATDARAVRRAVLRASRTVPGTTCLPQALVAHRLLRGAGLPSELTIGVAAGTAARRIDAHAWVRSGDVRVIGEDGSERYVALSAPRPLA